MDAIQDAIPDNHCYGCGALNGSGLQIKSYWTNDEFTESECQFEPQPHHCAGPLHVVNGGVIATIIDCHCVCTAIAKGYLKRGRGVGEGERVWFATGQLNVSYLKPMPMSAAMRVCASIQEVKERKIVLSCDVWANDEKVAAAEVIAVKVPNEWFEPQAPKAKEAV